MPQLVSRRRGKRGGGYFVLGPERYFSVVNIAFQTKTFPTLPFWKVQDNKNNNNGGLVAPGGRKSSIPAVSHDTLRDGRKGDPQQ